MALAQRCRAFLLRSSRRISSPTARSKFPSRCENVSVLTKSQFADVHAKSVSKIEAKIAATLAKFSCRKSFLIGVSGGRDSVALLHLLVARGYKKLIVCHLDHGLRGAA